MSSQSLLSVRQAITDAIRAHLDPALAPTVSTYRGRAEAEELSTLVVDAPVVLVGCLGFEGVEESGGQHEADALWVAWVITKDFVYLEQMRDRDDLALMLIDLLGTLIEGNRWALAANLPREINASNLYDADGVAVWSITWRQAVDLIGNVEETLDELLTAAISYDITPASSDAARDEWLDEIEILGHPDAKDLIALGGGNLSYVDRHLLVRADAIDLEGVNPLEGLAVPSWLDASPYAYDLVQTIESRFPRAYPSPQRVVYDPVDDQHNLAYRFPHATTGIAMTFVGLWPESGVPVFWSYGTVPFHQLSVTMSGGNRLMLRAQTVLGRRDISYLAGDLTTKRRVLTIYVGDELEIWADGTRVASTANGCQGLDATVADALYSAYVGYGLALEHLEVRHAIYTEQQLADWHAELMSEYGVA